MASTQALELRGLERASQRSQAVVEEYRRVVPYLREDRLVHADLVATAAALHGIVRPGEKEAPAPGDSRARHTSAVFLKATAHELPEEPELAEPAAGSQR
jgi:hypothetical protein